MRLWLPGGYPEICTPKPCRGQHAMRQAIYAFYQTGIRHLWLSAAAMLYSLNEFNDLNDDCYPMLRHP